MKFLLTGGHLTPALALVDYIRTQEPHSDIVFVGRTYTSEKLGQKSRESEEIRARQGIFETLNVPRFNHHWPHHLAIEGCIYIWSFLKSMWIVAKHRPTIMISFGGYLAVPVAVACWLLRVPIITHEQTLTAGEANRFIAKLAQKIAVSFPESATHFPKHKTIVTGNPIRQELFITKPKKPIWIDNPINFPIIFITGGNQGSYIINTTVSQAIASLTKKYLVIHACGRATNQANYFHELSILKEKLSSLGRDNYFIREWVTARELAWIYSQASCVVTRAGANTIQELALFKIPSVIIPLPDTKGDEQLKNAKFLSATNGATILLQKDLNAKSLRKNIDDCVKFQKSNRIKLSKLKVETEGARRLYEVIINL